MKKYLILVLVTLMILPVPTLGEESHPVTLTLLSDSQEDVRSFNATLQANLSPSLINDQLLLSYHVRSDIKSQDDSSILRYDNPMYVPLTFDDAGIAVAEIFVSIRDMDATLMFIEYDIFDQRNNRWFSTLPDVDMQAVTRVEYSRFQEMFGPIFHAFTSNPAIAILNVLVFTAAAIALIIARRKKLLNF